MTLDLDRTDRRILRLMQSDGNLSVAQIADKVGLTPPPCWRRIKRLQESGYLKKCVYLVDPKKLGMDVTIFASVKLTAHGRENVNAFRDEVVTFPEIMECYILLGAIDVLLKILIKDVESYQDLFFNKISQIPGVQEVNSSVVVSEIKQTTEIPIPG